MSRTASVASGLLAIALLSGAAFAQSPISGEVGSGIAGALAAGAAAGALAQGSAYLQAAPEQLEGLLADAEKGQDFASDESCLAHLQLAGQFAALARNTMPFSDAWTFEDERGPVVRLRVMLGGARTHVELSCDGSRMLAKELPWGTGSSDPRPLQLSSLDAGLGALFILNGEGAFDEVEEGDPDLSGQRSTKPVPLPSSSLPSESSNVTLVPPLTDHEKQAFTIAIQRCWNVPVGLRDAEALRVTVGAELGADGTVISANVRLISPQPTPDPASMQLFEATRRALIRCSPFADLPREKYARWRSLEITADPTGVISW